MGSNDVGAALQKMAGDPEVVERMAAGDFSDLPDADLTAEERAMVTAAAADIPDVDGFIFMKMDDIEVVDHKADDFTGKIGTNWSPNIIKAARHAGWKVEEGER